MPTFKIGPFRYVVGVNVCNMLQRCLAYSRLGFPLTVDEVQAIMVDPETVARLRAVGDSGFDTSGHQVRAPDLCIEPGALAPLTPRGVVIDVLLPTPVFGFRVADVDLSRLPPARRLALAEWVKGAVYAERKVKLAQYTVHRVMGICATTRDLQHVWPTLGRFGGSKLTTYMRRTTPSTRTKEPPIELSDKLRALVVASDVIIAECEMMLKNVNDPSPVKASVTSYTRLPSDPD